MNTSAPQIAALRSFRAPGLHHTPAKFAVQYANSEAEVVYQVAAFLSYLQQCHVTALLPAKLGTLRAETAADICASAEIVRQARASHAPLTATARFWIEEADEVLDAASRRLDALSQAM